MKYYSLAVAITLIFCHVEVQAQARLTGEVADKDGNPIAGVSVSLNRGLMQRQSDGDGKFAFTYPDTLKTRSISFQSVGYKTKTMILGRGQQAVRVILLDSVYSLGAMTVAAPRNGRFGDYLAQAYQMSAFDVVTNPSAMADIIGGMRVLSGVQTNDNDGRLIIHGGSSGESQVYINDLIVSNPYLLSAAKNVSVRSRFTPDLFSGIVLQSGGFNAELGQALSGVVNLSTKEHEQLTSKTDVSAILPFSLGFTRIDQKASYAYRASVDYSNLLFFDKIIGSTYAWKRPYQSISTDVFLSKKFSPDTKLTAQLNGSYGDGLCTYRDVDDAELESNVRQAYAYGQVNFYHAFSSRWSLSAASNLIADGYSGTVASYKNSSYSKVATQNIWSHSKITLQCRVRNIVNRSGVELILNPYREAYSQGYSYTRSVHNTLAGVYSDTKLLLTPRLTASAGLRGEYSLYLKKLNLAPRLYLAYRLNPQNILSLAAGDYYQLPAMDYLKLSGSLDFTSVRKATASYSYVEKDSKFQLDAYYKKYDDAVAYLQGQFIDNSGYGRGWGVDVFWKSHLGALEYWLTYSYNDTKKKYDDFSEAIAPPYAARRSLNATLKYYVAPLKSLTGLSCNVSSGAPYYSDELPRAALGTTPLRSRLDVSWSYLPRQWMVVHFACQNVLGKKNVYGYEYSKITAGVRREITAAYSRFYIVGVFVTFSSSKTLNQLKSL
jgi:hypothetical protein